MPAINDRLPLPPSSLGTTPASLSVFAMEVDVHEGDTARLDDEIERMTRMAAGSGAMRALPMPTVPLASGGQAQESSAQECDRPAIGAEALRRKLHIAFAAAVLVVAALALWT